MPKFYFIEPNGDFLSTEEKPEMWGPKVDVRGASLEGNPNTIEGSTAQREYLKDCKRVKADKVPSVWFNSL
jgi:hypothetical protein